MGGSLVLSVSVYFISACRSSSFNCRGGDNSQTEDVLKVNVADLETVTGSGGFFPSSSNVDIRCRAAKVETSSRRIKSSRWRSLKCDRNVMFSEPGEKRTWLHYFNYLLKVHGGRFPPAWSGLVKHTSHTVSASTLAPLAAVKCSQLVLCTFKR